MRGHQGQNEVAAGTPGDQPGGGCSVEGHWPVGVQRGWWVASLPPCPLDLMGEGTGASTFKKPSPSRA